MSESEDYKILKQLYKVHDNHFAEYWKWHDIYYLEESIISRLKSDIANMTVGEEDKELWRKDILP